MTFFYDLNKKLDSIREKPETTHKQLNERDEGKPGKNFEKIAKDAGERVAGAVRNKLKAQGKLEEEGMSRAAKGYEKYGKQGMEALAKAGREGKALDPIRKKYDKYDEGIEDRLKDLDPKNPVNIPAYQRKAAEQGVKPMSPKHKSFADKVAGAKKEVDEMLGDVAAEAMKSALSPKQKKIDMNKNGKLDANDFAILRKGGRQETDEGWDDMLKDLERRRSTPKVGDVRHGAKHDVEEIPGGRRVTRRTDPNTGYSVGTDDDTPADGEKRGRGRPKGSKAAIGAKGPSGKSKLMNREANHDENPNIAKAKAILKKAGYTVSKAGKEELEEKPVSQAQGIAARVARGVQKGEVKAKPGSASAEMAKMKPSELKKFAKGDITDLPKKKKPEGKKKEKTEEAGGTGTPTASSGFSYGKGIYDSMNRELESMIAEGMNVSMNMNSDANGGPSKSLTVTATDEDALKLGELLKNAGLGGGDHGYGGAGYKSACGCGTPNCSCGNEEMDEAYGDNSVSQNKPNWPTNTESSDDALQYSGGLNKPKSTGQSTTPVLASQEERQESYAEAEEDAIKRMMEMAGQPASGAGAQVGDMIDYVSPSGEQPPEDLIMQNGVVYDPDTNVISVRNATSLTDTHRAIEAAGWKKQTAGARPNPAAAGQAQQAGDTPYQLGEEDELARMMEMAGVKKKTDEEKTEEGNLFTGNLAKARAAGKKEADLDGDGKMEKVDEGILSATANLWSEYKGKYGV